MPLPLRQAVSLAAHTTLKVGGQAEWFVVAESEEEIKAAAHFAKQNALPLFVLGGGSNLLASDAGFPGVVLQVGLRGIMYEIKSDTEVLLTAAAGEELDVVVADTVTRGYWGLENLSHIPGSVGATPVQNVGAYGVEVSNCVATVRTIHLPTATERIFTNDECRFGYRDSFFKTPAGKEYVITAVTYRLSRLPLPRLQYRDLTEWFRGVTQEPSLVTVRSAIIAIRSKKFPDWRSVGTAGSFFKNPIITRAHAARLCVEYPDLPVYEVSEVYVKCSLGYILDKVCNLRGYTEGNVALYKEQALVVVATPDATATEITLFAKKIADIVFTRTQITIEWEVSEIKDY